jgi:hypothetical protein
MANVTVPRPAASEFASYYQGYVSQVPDGNLLAGLEQQGRDTVKLLRGIDEKKAQHRYAEGKWSIREVVGHLIDTERVFMYRALTFARGDQTSLPPFDENAWASTSNAGGRALPELIAEFEAIRAATLTMFRGFGDAEFARKGVANNNPFTVRAVAYIVAGHERHHVKILRERYGV